MKEQIEKLKIKIESMDETYLSNQFSESKIKKSEKISDTNYKNLQNEEFSNEIYDEEDMSIISFLIRSYKRVQILKSVSQTPKIPSIISKEIGDSSHHISKYLTSLKEKGLVICLHEEDKRFRFYSITAKGKHYLEIIENKKILKNENE